MPIEKRHEGALFLQSFVSTAYTTIALSCGYKPIEDNTIFRGRKIAIYASIEE